MTIYSSPPESICILRLSAIGDVCNTIAAVQALQSHWPTTKVTWITGKLEAELLKAVPGVDIIIFDKGQGWKAYFKLWHRLRKVKFDALLHMQYALRASIVSLGIRSHYRLGFDKVRSRDGQRLFTNYKVPSPTSPHVLDGICAFVNELGVPTFEPKWALSYKAKDAQWAKSVLSSHKKNIVIVPGASKTYKNWTAQGYADVIAHAQSKGYNIILAGSPANVEVQLGRNIEILLSKPVTNVIGQSSLLELLALIDKALLVVSPDTGPTHMANAMATAVIGLYAHHDPARTGPYNYQNYVVSAYCEALADQSRSNKKPLNWRTRIKDPSAMTRISSEKVINKFEQVISELAEHRD